MNMYTIYHKDWSFDLNLFLFFVAFWLHFKEYFALLQSCLASFLSGSSRNRLTSM